MKEIISKFKVESQSSSRVYVVSKYDDGSWACSCPSWIFKKGHKENCKHILEIINVNYKPKPKIETTISITGIMDELKKSEVSV